MNASELDFVRPSRSFANRKFYVPKLRLGVRIANLAMLGKLI